MNRQLIRAAGIAAVLMLTASAGHAQSRPFAGLDGAWSGNGTISLSDGSSERIRCRASYKVDGTGLGLSITHAMVSDHGGRMEVESAAGQGTRFRVILPLSKPAA